ncbi:MAG TPA: glycosyltransferase [Opitutus sp.]|nr:glycosyltransferase [Opitutus sp.]
MKFLRVIATLDPRHGGPAAGLRAITPALAALGHETTFVSMDAPAEAASFAPAAPLHALGPARNGYAYSRRLEPWLREHAPEFDAVFVHGLWQYHGRAVRRALRGRGIPYFVFPHGMLDPWFRRAHPLKHAKKWAYWQVCERLVLRDAAAVCFTCDEERRLAEKTFRPYRCTTRVVAYGTSAPDPEDADQHLAKWRSVAPPGGRPFWLFLGRIDPKKGVDVLLRAYARIAAEGDAQLPALVLAGPCSDPNYRSSLDAAVRRLPPNAHVFWPGMLQGAAKWGALRAAEAFILPSHQENFGIAVVEALAVGSPVLISRQINIWKEIVDAGAGLAATDDVDGAVALLHRWRATPPDRRSSMQSAAHDLFETRYEINRAARSLAETVRPFVSGPDAGAHMPGRALLSPPAPAAAPPRFSR